MPLKSLCLMMAVAMATSCATVSRQDHERTTTINSWTESGPPGSPELTIEQDDAGETKSASLIRGTAVLNRRCDVTYFDEKEVEIYQDRSPRRLASAYLLGVGFGGGGGAMLGTAHLVPKKSEDDEGNELHPRGWMYTFGSIAATVGAVFLTNAIVSSFRSIDRTEEKPNRTDTRTAVEICETEPLANTELFAREPDLNLDGISIGRTDGDGHFEFDVVKLGGFKYPSSGITRTLALKTNDEDLSGRVELGDGVLEPSTEAESCITSEGCQALKEEFEEAGDDRLSNVIASLDARIREIRHDEEELPYKNAVSIIKTDISKVSNYSAWKSRPYLERSAGGDRFYVRRDRINYENMGGIEYRVKLTNDSDRFILGELSLKTATKICFSVIVSYECNDPSNAQMTTPVLVSPGRTQSITGFIPSEAKANDAFFKQNIHISGRSHFDNPMSVPDEFTERLELLLENNFDRDMLAELAYDIENSGKVDAEEIAARLIAVEESYRK